MIYKRKQGLFFYYYWLGLSLCLWLGSKKILHFVFLIYNPNIKLIRLE